MAQTTSEPKVKEKLIQNPDGSYTPKPKKKDPAMTLAEFQAMTVDDRLAMLAIAMELVSP